jgi:microsomal dipeptidase-like Zn-dependent dipeptidase
MAKFTQRKNGGRIAIWQKKSGSPALLKKRGYKKAEIEGIMSGNFLNFLRKNLPA